MPNPLRLAVIARAIGHEDYLPGAPIFLQRSTIAVLAVVGRALGYRAG